MKPKFWLIAIVSIALTGTGVAPANAAGSDSGPDKTQGLEEISAFAEALNVSPAIEGAFERAFLSLDAEGQTSFLSALRHDPLSVINLGDATATAIPVSQTLSGKSGAQSQPDTSSGRDTTQAVAVRAYGFRHVAPVQALGITFGSFTLDYKYEANAEAVTRNLDCQGWWSGYGLSGSTRETQYISKGRGTCSARHSMSVLFQGFPLTFNKLHTVSTVAGQPRSVRGFLSTL